MAYAPHRAAVPGVPVVLLLQYTSRPYPRRLPVTTEIDTEEILRTAEGGGGLWNSCREM
jgi:hypothetical protein